MKAICVVNETELEIREVPQPSAPPADGHLLVQIESCAINPGDKYFLFNPVARAIISGAHDVWGASGVGLVDAVGKNVPEHYKGQRVAVYRSLVRTPDTIGLWCQTAQVHHLSCLVLPDNVNASDYAGSLVNVITAYAFLEQSKADGHKGVIATAGNSATGRCLMELARLKNIPSIALVRTAVQREELTRLGFTNVLDTSDESFEDEFQKLAQQLGTTAIFEGVGGDLVTRIAPLVPRNSTFYFYGFLAGPASFTVQSRMMLEKNLTLRSFSNFMTRTVQEPELLAQALAELSAIIEHPAFRTKIGGEFKFDQIQDAMKFLGESGSKCLLVP